jgi:hypothetical protein
LKNPTIPRISLSQGKLCSLEELELQRDKPTEQSHDKHEMYAKMALLMFYPFRQLNKQASDGSCCKLFYRELHHHLKNKTTKFWKKASILQNIEDRSTLQKHLKRARGPIAMSTINMKPKESQYEVPKSPCGNNNVIDILQMGSQSK